MTRTLLIALLALSSSAALAGQKVGESFTAATLGDAAARVQVPGKPLALEVHVPVTVSRAFPLEALHGFFKPNGFDVEVQTELRDGKPVPGAPMTLVARKEAVMTKQDIDGYSAEVTRIVPKDTKVSWRFLVPKTEAKPAPAVSDVAPATGS